MCGIAAALGQPARVSEVIRELAHRGPDAVGVHQDGDAALGAARLRINGDERSDQPLGRDGLYLVANGEVFNHRLLGPAVDGGSDLVSLLGPLRTDGHGALALVRGPFAVAAWNRAPGTLLLARDEIGIRPLHVQVSGDGILASSEPWPLIRRLGPAPVIDRDAAAHLIAFQFLPPGRTLFRDVVTVRPGEAWLAGGESVRSVVRYPLHYAGPAEPTLALALRAAARMQATMAHRSAIFLSGGLDSSAVAGLLVEAGAKPTLALVGWFPGAPELDERPHARAVARELGLELVEVPISAEAAWAALPNVIRRLGGPQAGPGALAQWVLASAAADLGVKVVYTGQGGDEIFGGYERHRLLQQIAAGGALHTSPDYASLAEAMARSAAPYATAVFRGAEILPLLDSTTRNAVSDAARRELPTAGPWLADRALAFENERFLPGLLAVDDATLAAFGIESRVPLLDPVVARLARSVPLAQKSPPDAPRRLFREALGTALPEAARRRTDKMGFPMPLAAWLAGPWRDLARDLLAGTELSRFGFDAPRTREACADGRLSPRGRWFVLALATLGRLLSERHQSAV